MAGSGILVDTNAYLRLAKTFHPLLNQPFGKENHCLYIIPALNMELQGNRLKTAFAWVSEAQYVENRNAFPDIDRQQINTITQSFDFIWDQVQSELPGPSRVDVRYIATALELKMPLVTDDKAMKSLAREYGVKVMSTLQLVRLMVDAGEVSLKQVEALVGYWKYMKDLPGNFRRDFGKYFGGNKKQ